MIGYNCWNGNDLSNNLFHTPISERELLALATFMQNGGGVLATGDHDSLGSYMAAQIPRIFIRVLEFRISSTDILE